MNALIRISHAAFTEIQNALFGADLPSADKDGVLHLSGVNLADVSLHPVDPLPDLLEELETAAADAAYQSDQGTLASAIELAQVRLENARAALKNHIETLKATK